MDRTALPHLVLIRPTGELATKSRPTRRRFQRRLVQCVEDALGSAGLSFRVREEWGRLFVETSSPAALDVLARVFGITSFSQIEGTAEPRLDAIVEVGTRLYGERVRGRTFAVRARRAGRHPFSSKDINYELGAALNPDAEVDLDDPDIEVGVEVRDEAVYFYSRRIAGAGGLPLVAEGRAAALLSGGYDSAVAAWMMLKRGVALDYIFCNLAGGAYERSVLAVAKLLADQWSYGTRPTIHVIPFEELIAHLRDRVHESYWQVVLKRLMYRAAERVSREIGARAIITGESVGQVSSQTLANLCAIEPSVAMPVLRPLVGFDKAEIIDRSRAIGTYPLSEKVREYCALTERRPIIDASPDEAAGEEAKLELARLDEAVAARRVLDLRELDASELVMPYLYTTEIPPGAVVIDTRTRNQYEPWHYPGALHREFWALYGDVSSLDRERTYVFYCDIGLKTAQLAERLQRAGFDAYSFKGGVKALQAYVASRGLQPA